LKLSADDETTTSIAIMDYPHILIIRQKINSSRDPIVMPLPFQFDIPGAQLSVSLEAGETTIFVGANGSGKTRLAATLERVAGIGAHRISAHRALTLNPNIPKISQEDSRQVLRTGYNGQRLQENQIAGVRDGNRWGSKSATHLLNDFDALLQWLFAEQNNIALETHNKAHEGKRNELKRLKTVWERVLPTKRLFPRGDTIEVGSAENPGIPLYSAAEMSDGERAVFYMIGQVLFTDPESILIFDEPELHVHRSILGRLWDELEGERPDCSFVLITHDLEFAASRPARKYVLESFLPPDSWKVQAVPEDTGFSEQLTAMILGSRRPILFVEGDGNSIDLAIYRACFPDMTVVARGSCERVIQSVKIMRANDNLTRVTCAGMVDADSRNASDVAHLEGMGVYVLPVSEIENLLALPAIASVILDYDLHEDSEKQARLGRLKQTLFADAASPDTQTTIALDHCRRRIDRALKIVSFTDEPDEAALQAELTRQVNEIDVAVIGTEIRKSIADAIAADDLPALLKVYDRKEFLLASLSALKGVKKNAFVSWVGRAIKAAKQPQLRKAIGKVLPTPVAR
jgi:ABC-type cobalamin/Fe3+-siderophores transport system ATPase subunit